MGNDRETEKGKDAHDQDAQHAHEEPQSQNAKSSLARQGAQVVDKILSAHANDPKNPRVNGPQMNILDFDELAERRALQDELAAKLEAKYGVSPKAHAGLFDAPNAQQEAQREGFELAVRRAVKIINAKLEAQGSPIRLTQAEVAMNCLAEGSILYLRGESMQHRGADGKPAAGIDFFKASGVLDFEEKKKDPKVAALMPEGVNPEDGRLDSAVSANAAIWASLIPQVIADIGEDAWAKLPPEGQFYWKTVYYNRGPGNGRRFLHNQAIENDLPGERNTKGIDAWKTPLSKEDGAQEQANAKYNAAWRTASFEMMNRAADLDENATKPEGKQLLPMMQISLVEGLDMEKALAEELFAAGEAADERRLQDLIYLVDEIEERNRGRTKADYEPAAWAKVETGLARAKEDRAKAQRLLVKEHGARGAQWPTKVPVIQDLYKQLNATGEVFREMPRLDLMTDAQYKLEYAFIADKVKDYGKTSHAGFVVMQSWFESIH